MVVFRKMTRMGEPGGEGDVGSWGEVGKGQSQIGSDRRMEKK